MRKFAAIAAKHLRLIVTGPSTIQAGVPTEYLVSTTDVTGQPLPAKVEVTLRADDGRAPEGVQGDGRRARPLARHHSHRSEAAAPDAVSRRRVARREPRRDAEATLAVESAGYDAQLALDRPLYQPGDTVRYRSLVLSRFGLTADRDVPVHFEILDPAGAVRGRLAAGRGEQARRGRRRVCDPRPNRPAGNTRWSLAPPTARFPRRSGSSSSGVIVCPS